MRLPAEIYLMWTGVLHVYCLVTRINWKNFVNIVIIANDITG